MYKRQTLSQEEISTIKNDFIRHPLQSPITIKRKRDWNWFAKHKPDNFSELGISFRTQEYFAAGSRIEVSIPLRNDSQQFVGTVVMVREIRHGFEIGLWLENEQDEARARLVEKICHTECYLKARTEEQPHASGALHRSRRLKRPSRADGRDRNWLGDFATPMTN